jgi:hypothetical protein
MDLIEQIINEAFNNDVESIELKFMYPKRYNSLYAKNQTGYTLHTTANSLRLFDSDSTTYTRELDGKYLMVVKNSEGEWYVIESSVNFTKNINMKNTTNIIQYLGNKTRYFGSSQFPADSLRVSYLG